LLQSVIEHRSLLLLCALHLLDLIILTVDQLVFLDDLLLGFSQLLLARLVLLLELGDLNVLGL
jgi:hypothetical protein